MMLFDVVFDRYHIILLLLLSSFIPFHSELTQDSLTVSRLMYRKRGGKLDSIVPVLPRVRQIGVLQGATSHVMSYDEIVRLQFN